VGVTDFDTKIAVVVRDDLATWQRLNVTAFLISGVTAQAGPAAIGEDYADADNRAAVRSVTTAKLDLVGLGLRAPHRDADAILRGIKRHP
jgi:hypothetical protein